MSSCLCKIEKIAPEVDSLNIGGGFPIKTSLNFDYDYAYMVNEIVSQIKKFCEEEGLKNQISIQNLEVLQLEKVVVIFIKLFLRNVRTTEKMEYD
jgi:hypothetical protein